MATPIASLDTTTTGAANKGQQQQSKDEHHHAASNYSSLPDCGNAQGIGLNAEEPQQQQQQQQQQPPLQTRNSAPFEQEEKDDGINSDSSGDHHGSSWWSRTLLLLLTVCSDSNNRISSLVVVQTCYMSLAAILGCLLRILLAQFFGEECKNPGTVGWLSAASPLCVTRDGETEQMGSIIFADLPANMLGSFLMGLLQDSQSLGLAVPTAPIAWLRPSHAFQGYTVLHLALRTGFCGSLTTFSSWIAEMTVMMVGEEATHRESQFWKALFGFLIGIQTALGSFMFGRTVAIWLNQWRNPSLAKEAIAVQTRKEQGYRVNPHLPALERRFLLDLPLCIDGAGDDNNEDYPPTSDTTPGLESLSQWRESTYEARRLEHPASETLQQLETALWVDHQPFSPKFESICRTNGWDHDALKYYLRFYTNHTKHSSTGYYDPSFTAAGVCQTDRGARLFQWPYAVALLTVVMAINATLLATIPSDNAYDITYRTMVYSFLLAPFGAIFRWRLGKAFNNGLSSPKKLKWIPAGTMAANYLGSFLSVAMIACEYRLEENVEYGFWTVASFRAVKLGFCGCLTTVSTFIAEVHAMMTQHKRDDRAYTYIVFSLTGSALLAAIAFCLIVYTAPNY
jgi:CrcB protein